jgi:hypothetical protein
MLALGGLSVVRDTSSVDRDTFENLLLSRLGFSMPPNLGLDSRESGFGGLRLCDELYGFDSLVYELSLKWARPIDCP